MNEAILSKRMVEIEYWDCGISGHSHKNKETAGKCMKRRDRKGPKLTLKERQLRMVSLSRRVILGETYAAAGASVGVSGGRCVQIINKLMRMSLHRSRFSGPIPEDAYADIREVRRNPAFWLARIDAMSKEFAES